MPRQDQQQGDTPNIGKLNGAEIPLDYGAPRAEAECLRTRAGILNLSARGRICLLGGDRHRFLNGQTTNNIIELAEGTGCYTLMTNRKGIIQGDAAVYQLPEEILLDLEPSGAAPLAERLQQFIVADDVEIVDAAPHFGLLSIQGPVAGTLLEVLEIAGGQEPQKPHDIVSKTIPRFGEFYVAKHPRTGTAGYDIFIRRESLEELQKRLLDRARSLGGGLCGWDSLETLRIEAGIPRYPIDMTPSILAPELGREAQTISYAKGCYLGQEVINRIRSIGRLNRRLAGIVFGAGDLSGAKGSLFDAQKAVGFLTSTTYSHTLKRSIGLAFIRRDRLEPGTALQIKLAPWGACHEATVSKLPFEV